MREHADPVPAIADALRAFYALPSNVALFGVMCRVAENEVPTDWSLRTDPPLVVVYDDGGPETWPIKRDPTVRITVRARGVPLAKRVAARADGYLHVIDNFPDGIAYISRLGRGTLVVARDTDTGADMASFTITAMVPTIETV